MLDPDPLLDANARELLNYPRTDSTESRFRVIVRLIVAATVHSGRPPEASRGLGPEGARGDVEEERDSMYGLVREPRHLRNGCGHYGNAKTKRSFPMLGRNSGVNCRKLAVVAARPVLTAMYCRPSTAKLIGKPETRDPRLISQSTSPVS